MKFDKLFDKILLENSENTDNSDINDNYIDFWIEHLDYEEKIKNEFANELKQYQSEHKEIFDDVVILYDTYENDYDEYARTISKNCILINLFPFIQWTFYKAKLDDILFWYKNKRCVLQEELAHIANVKESGIPEDQIQVHDDKFKKILKQLFNIDYDQIKNETFVHEKKK